MGVYLIKLALPEFPNLSGSFPPYFLGVREPSLALAALHVKEGPDW